MSAHTPGPWQAVEDEQHLLSPDQFRIWINAEGLHVAYVDGPRTVERVANAALTGAEGVRVEGTVRGENPGKDEQ